MAAIEPLPFGLSQRRPGQPLQFGDTKDVPLGLDLDELRSIAHGRSRQSANRPIPRSTSAGAVQPLARATSAAWPSRSQWRERLRRQTDQDDVQLPLTASRRPHSEPVGVRLPLSPLRSPRAASDYDSEEDLDFQTVKAFLPFDIRPAATYSAAKEQAGRSSRKGGAQGLFGSKSPRGGFTQDGTKSPIDVDSPGCRTPLDDGARTPVLGVSQERGVAGEHRGHRGKDGKNPFLEYEDHEQKSRRQQKWLVSDHSYMKSCWRWLNHVNIQDSLGPMGPSRYASHADCASPSQREAALELDLVASDLQGSHKGSHHSHGGAVRNHGMQHAELYNRTHSHPHHHGHHSYKASCPEVAAMQQLNQEMRTMMDGQAMARNPSSQARPRAGSRASVGSDVPKHPMTVTSLGSLSYANLEMAIARGSRQNEQLGPLLLPRKP